MTALRALFDEVVGMFVDDGSLALLAVALVAIVTLAVKLAGLPPLPGACVIVAGTIIILGISLARGARKR